MLLFWQGRKQVTMSNTVHHMARSIDQTTSTLYVVLLTLKTTESQTKTKRLEC